MTKKKEKRKVTSKTTYEGLLEQNPEFEGVIHKESWDFIGYSDENTLKGLFPLWKKNIEINVRKKYWNRRRSVHKLAEIALNKAVIVVGAGQSFNKNKHVLKQIYDMDILRDPDDRYFIIVASNHQFKPLLNMGIVPDFVMLADGSDVVMSQLCKDIPKSGQSSILLDGLQCSPTVTKEWLRQKREILFYLPRTKGLPEIFNKITHKNPDNYIILQGGNVLNSAWSISLKFMHADTFIALGNDLSFPLQKTIEEQRTTYYADGDYSSNAPGTGTGRDEANAELSWGGFSLTRKRPMQYDVELDQVGTTHTLWVYKTWIETNVYANDKTALNYHYYNCSEGGILGVMTTEMRPESYNDKNNWFLLDKKCTKWHTAMLEDAAEKYIQGRNLYGRKTRQPFKVS